jgi:hypothetical protein
VAAFALKSIVDSNTVTGDNSKDNNEQSNAKGASVQSKTRQDTIFGLIIGVVRTQVNCRSQALGLYTFL